MMRLFLLLSLLCACAPESVLLVTFPEDAAADAGPGRDGGGERPRCRSQADCAESELCDTFGCTTTEGTCLPRSTSCDTREFAPVCGCNGVIYYNDCLRRAAGVSRNAGLGCNALSCVEEGSCPQGSRCARLLEGGAEWCDEERLGNCVVLPGTCPRDTFGAWYSPCDGPDQCVDLCTAMRSERLHFTSTRCFSRPRD